MIRRAFVVGLVVVLALLALPSAPASAQVLCDPTDHCWSAKDERQAIDSSGKFVAGVITSGQDPSLKDGQTCWHLNIPNYWREWWVWTRTIITQTVTVRWCWDHSNHLTSMTTSQSYQIASFSFWVWMNQNVEAATGDPTGGTWAYRRLAMNFNECNPTIFPLCVNVKMWTAVTVHGGTAGGPWTVDRGAST